MKNKFWGIFALAILCAVLTPRQAQAQYAYGYSEVGYSSSARYVYGYSATWVDYYAAYYYDPEVHGMLLKLPEDEIPLDEGRAIGFSDPYYGILIAAEVDNFSTAYQQNTTYEEYSTHFVRPYYPASSNCFNCWFDPYGFSLWGNSFYGGYYGWPNYFYNPYYTVSGNAQVFGRLMVRITTPDDNQCSPGMSFTPSGNACPNPTPTPPQGSVSVKYSIVVLGGHNVPLANKNAPAAAPDLAYANSMKMTATGTPGGGTYRWTTSSNKITLSGAETATVTVTSKDSRSESEGDVLVELVYTSPGGLSTNPVQIRLTVQEPASMRYVSTGVNQRLASCKIPGEENRDGAGWRKDIVWQVYDHLKRPMSFRMPVSDTINNEIPNSCNNKKEGEGTEHAEGKGTGGGGQWTHIYTECSSVCLKSGANCEVKGYQRYTINGFVLGNDDKKFSYRCDGIWVEGEPAAAPAAFVPPANQSTPNFVDSIWVGTLGLLPLDADWQNWTYRLNNAHAQGEAQLLAEARTLARALFKSASYVNLNRTDEEYVSDMYLVYLNRRADDVGFNYWLSVMRDDYAAGRDGREHMLSAFELSGEFMDRVRSLLAELPPSSCDPFAEQLCYNNGGSWYAEGCLCEYYEPQPDPCWSSGYYYCY